MIQLAEDLYSVSHGEGLRDLFKCENWEINSNKETNISSSKILESRSSNKSKTNKANHEIILIGLLY